MSQDQAIAYLAGLMRDEMTQREDEFTAEQFAERSGIPGMTRDASYARLKKFERAGKVTSRRVSTHTGRVRVWRMCRS